MRVLWIIASRLRRCLAHVQERLGVLLEKEDEMDCLVGGANFLLKAIHHEAFMYENSQTLFTHSNCEHCYPSPSLCQSS